MPRSSSTLSQPRPFVLLIQLNGVVAGYLVISIWQLTPSCEKQKYTVAVSHTDTPLQVVKEVR
jgi:type IV secretory pathway component VirB8